MRKICVVLFLTLLLVSVLAGSSLAADGTGEPVQTAEVVQDITNYLWEIPEDASEEDYIKLMNRNFRIIQAFELLFTEDSYEAYSKVYARQFKRSQSYEDAQKVVEAQSLLVQKTSIADGAWFLWGTNENDNANGYAWFTRNIGPVVDGEEEILTEEALDDSEMDGFGQGPVLIKCLLDDPAQAKGNIILISGGGFSQRSNPAEGYAAIPCFNGLGYNCFLLQRRVAPYSREDIFMDLQRAIRLVRYSAEKEGWGGKDMIAAAGFSGGGSTIAGTFFTCYGQNTPSDEYDAEYIPDEIDSINSDLDVAMLIYGASTGKTYFNENNPSLPAIYMCVGTEDATGAYDSIIEFHHMMEEAVPTKLKVVEGAAHGFGVGQSSKVPDECAVWPLEADEFMMAHKGFSVNRGMEETDIPEKYTKVKYFYGMYTFTNSDVVFAMNEDETEFYAKYSVMSRENVIEGTVENGIVTVTFNAIGFADDDAQLMYEDAMDDEIPWEPVR